MTFTLILTEIRVATEQVRDDALECYFNPGGELTKYGCTGELEFKNDIMTIARFKKGFIEPGKEYVYREFVNENGRVGFMCSGVEMDKIALRNNLYPTFIINQI